MPWGGHPLCGRPAGYLSPGTVGQWPPATLQWRTESRAATRKPNRRGRLGPPAGIPKRKLHNCQRQKRYSRISVGCIGLSDVPSTTMPNCVTHNYKKSNQEADHMANLGEEGVSRVIVET